MSSSTYPAGGAQDHVLGHRLAEVAIGMDRLERRLSQGQGALDSEGLVAIWLGDGLVEPEGLAGWSDAERALDRLAEDAARLEPGARRDFVDALVVSLQTAAALFQGAELGYAAKLERLVGVPAAPVEEGLLVGLRDTIDAALTRQGVADGELCDRVRRWERARALEPERLEPTFRELMAEAKRRTDAEVFDTGDYDMVLAPVRDVPYTARCNFREAKMDLNLDLAFSRPALKHLVAHEVYPGHATQLLSTLDAARSGAVPLDALLCTLNGATGAVQEGIGDQGVHLIDWIEDDDDVLFTALRRLRSASQASAAWYLMEEGWSEDRARAYLRDDACGQPAWVEGRLRFARHPFRGPFIASYWYGDEAVREVRERVAPERRAAFLRFLYQGVHTPASLRRFEAA